MASGYEPVLLCLFARLKSVWGFLYGWTFYLVIQTGTIAAVAVAFARFLGVLVPSISESHKFFELGRFSLSPTTLVAISVVLLLTWSNTTGLKTGKTVQNIFTIAKIAALAGLILLGLLVGANATAINANFTDWWTATFTQPVARGGNDFSTAPLGGLNLWLVLGTAMVGSLCAADSWHSVTFTAAEVKNPTRNLPLSLFLGVSLVCLLYFLANVAYLVVLPLKGSATGTMALERGMQFALNDRWARRGGVVFGKCGGDHGVARDDFDLRLHQRTHPVRCPSLCHGSGPAVFQGSEN